MMVVVVMMIKMIMIILVLLLSVVKLTRTITIADCRVIKPANQVKLQSYLFLQKALQSTNKSSMFNF